MQRRGFLKLGAHAVVAGSGTLGSTRDTSRAKEAVARNAGDEGSSGVAHPPSLLRDYDLEDHRRRLQNIGLCSRAIRSCMRKHLITDYLPAQCCYNLGEYPCRKPWDPDEYDEGELDRLRDHGIQVLQVFDDWNDSLRLFGGTSTPRSTPRAIVASLRWLTAAA